MKHRTFLVIGGTGFVGRHLVTALSSRGARILVPTRRRERAKHLILLDRKSTRLNSSHMSESRMPSSA